MMVAGSKSLATSAIVPGFINKKGRSVSGLRVGLVVPCVQPLHSHRVAQFLDRVNFQLTDAFC